MTKRMWWLVLIIELPWLYLIYTLPEWIDRIDILATDGRFKENRP